MKTTNRSSFVDRFWNFVKKGKNKNDCWKWKGCCLDDGRGVITTNKKMLTSNRASWIVHYGPIPENRMVCHSCDNPPCTNPEHLWLGTAKQNSDDCMRKNRQAVQIKKSCKDHYVVRCCKRPHGPRAAKWTWEKSIEWAQKYQKTLKRAIGPTSHIGQKVT